MGLLTKIFGTYSDKELKQINKIIKKINSVRNLINRKLSYVYKPLEIPLEKELKQI